MKQNTKRIIVITHKKQNRYPDVNHGSWKIAYADFMTTMMALFLVLALVGSATPLQLQHVAEYFKMPLRSAFSGGNRYSDSESPIPGGGNDISKMDGEEQAIKNNSENPDTTALLEVGRKIVEIMQLDPRLKKLSANLIIELTELGLRIQILSHDKQPMFAIGSANIAPEMKAILHTIAPILNTLPNKMTLSGHTDERKYPTGDRGYSNWELSADRANASRRELITGGLDAKKIIRVIALADTVGLNNRHIGSDSNRRISILILNKEAHRSIENENIITGIDLLNHLPNAKKK